MQIGAFIPYFRNHSANDTKSAEPWTFGKEALDIARNYISLRYQLLPYLYSTFYESTQNGIPVMRSLAINYTFDPKVMYADFQNQYEFGSAFMVMPFESNKDYGKVYFPAGTWYDLYNGSKENGGQEKVIPLCNNRLPVYVKGGSIIPMQSLVQTTAEQPTDTLSIHIYNGDVANSFVYYEDDGKSFEYQKGDFYKRAITFDPIKHTIIFDAAEGKYTSHFKNIRLILHGFDQAATFQSGNTKLKLEDGQFAYLGTDVHNPAANCAVKFALISNSTCKIQLNY